MYKQVSFPIRINDCDYLGHVNNTVYFSYIWQATATLFPFTIASQLHASRVSIDYQRPAKFGNGDIAVDLWFRNSENAIYAIRQSNDIIATAQVKWYPSTELVAQITPQLMPVEPTVKVKDSKFQIEHFGKPFHWTNRIQTRELTASGYLDTSSFIHWVDEAVWRAIEHHGWSFQRMQQENCAVYIVSHHLEVFAHPQWLVGKNITIVSQLQNVRKVRGTWRHEFYLSGTEELLAREFVSGAFVTLDGQIREPAPGLIDICVLGSPMSETVQG
jgi:acyl-CoA thioesterase FadM